MSGGSWSYLYERLAIAPPAELRAAADRLRDLGDTEAAATLRRLANERESVTQRLEQLSEKLRLMEWIDSGDSVREGYRRRFPFSGA